MRNLIAVFILLCSGNALAMSCIIPPLEERYSEHGHVALVEVTDARIEESDGYSRKVPFVTVDSIEISVERRLRDPKWRRVVATIRVVESFKGETPPTTLMLTRWMQDPEITVGAMYLVFLNGTEVSLDCDGMPMVSDVDPEAARVIGELRSLRDSKPTP